MVSAPTPPPGFGNVPGAGVPSGNSTAQACHAARPARADNRPMPGRRLALAAAIAACCGAMALAAAGDPPGSPPQTGGRARAGGAAVAPAAVDHRAAAGAVPRGHAADRPATAPQRTLRLRPRPGPRAPAAGCPVQPGHRGRDHGRAADHRAVRRRHRRPEPGRGRQLGDEPVRRPDLETGLPVRQLDRGPGRGVPGGRPAGGGLSGQGEGARGQLAAGAACLRPGPADAGLHRAGVPRAGVDQRPDPADRGLLRGALDGRLEPRPDAGHQAAPHRLRLPAGRVRR